MSGDYAVGGTFKESREEAFKDFAFFDEETVPLNVSKPVSLEPLKPTAAIILTGYITANASRFAINLLCKTNANIALHFNPRLDRSYVVRNSKVRGYWEEEETCTPAGPSGQLFRRNTYIHLMIFCTTDAFNIAVNGDHFCAFTYRLPLEEITDLEVNGSLEDVRVRQLNLFVYPDSKICRPSRKLTLSVDQPLLDYLDVPITVDLESQVRVGTRIFITGRLKLLPHSLYVNLQKGNTIYPHPIIPLHLNPRFLYGSSSPYVVMNSWANGKWANEERHPGHLSWMPGRDFLLTIRCEHEAYTVWLDDKMICEFKHRIQPAIIDTLRISGDVVLYQLAMAYA